MHHENAPRVPTFHHDAQGALVGLTPRHLRRACRP
jgi:hypothetical protein